MTRRWDSLHDIIKCAKKPVSRRLSIKASGVGAERKREKEREMEENLPARVHRRGKREREIERERDRQTD